MNRISGKGSPHAHTLIWIKDAPKLGYSDEEYVTAFSDKHVSCSLPQSDEELHTLEESLQITIIHKHAEERSCRFNYPKPPSPSTIISHEPQDNSSQKVEFAVKILTAVKEVLDSKDLHINILSKRSLKQLILHWMITYKH